jgi:hypothetical protein
VSEVLALEETRRQLSHVPATVELVLQNTQKSKENSKHGYLSLYFEPDVYLVLYHDHRHNNKVSTVTGSLGLLELA